MIQVEIATLRAMLAVLGAVGGTLHTADVALLAAPFTPRANTEWADLTEATFTGYARVPIVAWSTPFIDQLGNATMVNAGVDYLMTDAVTPNVIYGYAIVTHVTPPTLPQLLYSESFPVPINLAAANDGFVLVPTFTLG